MDIYITMLVRRCTHIRSTQRWHVTYQDAAAVQGDDAVIPRWRSGVLDVRTHDLSSLAQRDYLQSVTTNRDGRRRC